MSRNWINEWDRNKNQVLIAMTLYKSKEGMTFGDLLKATRLSKPVLTQHLKRLSEVEGWPRIPPAPTLIQEGVGRQRRYKLHPVVTEEIDELGAISFWYHLGKKFVSPEAMGRYFDEKMEQYTRSHA